MANKPEQTKIQPEEIGKWYKIPRIYNFIDDNGEVIDPNHVEVIYEDEVISFYETDCHQKIKEVFPIIHLDK